MSKRATTLHETKWTADSRKRYFSEHPENFADQKNKSYPIQDASDVSDAWDLAGHAENPDAVRAAIIHIAAHLGYTHALPQTAKQSARESLSPEAFSPKPRVARIKVQWLEDDAISQNGRQYPKEAVDQLIRSAQLTLSNPHAAPLTCYINHGAADNDNTLELVGKLAEVWREGTCAFAYIDIPDTRAGRDVASLAVGGYLKTESLRAENAKITHDRAKGLPQVGGDDLCLKGIDFTTTPGIASAHIQNIILEDAENEKFSETFELSSQAILFETEKGATMDPKDLPLTEAANVGAQGIPSTTSGDSPSVTSGPTQDTYGRTHYPVPDLTSGPMQGEANVPEMLEAVKSMHDHSASVLGMQCAPANSAQEAGKILSAKNRKHLASMHEKAASTLKLACQGNASDGMQDGDDDDQPQERKEKPVRELTEAQQLEALRKAGYTISAPKTEAELLKEQLEAMKAEHAELREMVKKGQQTTEAAPARRSHVMGANVAPKNKPYTPGSYLKEQLRNADWQQLADRTCPLPENLSLEFMIKEFTDTRLVQHFDQYGWPEAFARELNAN